MIAKLNNILAVSMALIFLYLGYTSLDNSLIVAFMFWFFAVLLAVVVIVLVLEKKIAPPRSGPPNPMPESQERPR